MTHNFSNNFLCDFYNYFKDVQWLKLIQNSLTFEFSRQKCAYKYLLILNFGANIQISVKKNLARYARINILVK